MTITLLVILVMAAACLLAVPLLPRREVMLEE
ncbi:hypothetical protein JOF43_001358 [Brachybacterium sacelli]|uniref:Uncharacterized protein n=1 Tax=Brachybacterium sacelli TaxID=173364 RepID=A0ABS4WZ77_9MICO|nr:hypothetical protein [Brachybacterium sacelli]